MKTLKESLFSKKNLDKKHNKYGITEKDMIGKLEGFPVGLVVRMMEEQEKQGNEANIKTFQIYLASSLNDGGFDWEDTQDGPKFWRDVIFYNDFDLFFDKYPEYEKYN